MMRTKLILGMAALLLASVPASAQQQTPAASDLFSPENLSRYGQIDFGARVTDVDGDPARYQRYRDLRDGAFFDMPMFHREFDSWWMTAAIRNGGYRDQRYSFTAASPGRVKFEFLYDQTPTYISGETATPYTPRPQENGFYTNSGAVLALPDDVQARLQANRSNARSEIEALATGFQSRIRRDTLGFVLTIDPNEHWRAKVNYRNTKKEGSIPWGASFGFSLPIEIALPIDTRTNDFGASVEWKNNRGMLRVGYDGSNFTQNVPAYVWDNPIRITDRTYSSAYSPGDGTSQGRGSQWPSNSFQYINFGGAYRLPSKTSVNGTLSIGQASQDEALLPYTINTAIAPLDSTASLDRLTAAAKANLGAATLNLVTRPSRDFNIRARYRFTRYDNQTPHFERHEYVRLDQVEEPGHSPLFYGYTRNYLDVDGAYTGVQHATFRVGYGYNGADLEERVYFKTNENTFRASVDTVGSQYVSFRSLYERSQRRGDGFHEAVLDEVGEQPGMRHFDIGDRDRDRVTLLANLMPTGDFSVNASIAWTRDTYLNPEQPANNSFGLLDYKSQTYGLGFDYVPQDEVSVGASYSYDKYTGRSQSRNASPGAQFVDPNRNWTTDEDQYGHSIIAYVDLLKLIENTDLRFGYDYMKYNGSYLYTTGTAYSPSPNAPGRVGQLPTITAEENRFTTDLRYFIRRNVAIGFAYWFDKYDVEDFQLGAPGETFVEGIARPPIDPSQPANSAINGIVLNYFYRPYTAHTAWVRLTYLF